MPGIEWRDVTAGAIIQDVEHIVQQRLLTYSGRESFPLSGSSLSKAPQDTVTLQIIIGSGFGGGRLGAAFADC